MLQFHREDVRSPHLVLVTGRGRGAGDHGTERAGDRGLRSNPAIALVLIATLVAVVVDLVDSVPAWSPWAVLGSAIVLVTHATMRRLRTRTPWVGGGHGPSSANGTTATPSGRR